MSRFPASGGVGQGTPPEGWAGCRGQPGLLTLTRGGNVGRRETAGRLFLQPKARVGPLGGVSVRDRPVPGAGALRGIFRQLLPGSSVPRGCGLSPGSRGLSRSRGPGGQAPLPARRAESRGSSGDRGVQAVPGSRFPRRGATAAGLHVTAMRAAGQPGAGRCGGAPAAEWRLRPRAEGCQVPGRCVPCPSPARPALPSSPNPAGRGSPAAPRGGSAAGGMSCAVPAAGGSALPRSAAAESSQQVGAGVGVGVGAGRPGSALEAGGHMGLSHAGQRLVGGARSPRAFALLSPGGSCGAGRIAGEPAAVRGKLPVAGTGRNQRLFPRRRQSGGHREKRREGRGTAPLAATAGAAGARLSSPALAPPSPCSPRGKAGVKRCPSGGAGAQVPAVGDGVPRFLHQWGSAASPGHLCGLPPLHLAAHLCSGAGGCAAFTGTVQSPEGRGQVL